MQAAYSQRLPLVVGIKSENMDMKRRGELMNLARISLTLLVGVQVGSSAFAQEPTDWPRWRGPNADGVADGRNLPVRWSKTENIRWSVKLPGWGTSSPVVYGNRVFVTSHAGLPGWKDRG